MEEKDFECSICDKEIDYDTYEQNKGLCNYCYESLDEGSQNINKY